jgi:hypothetical protein
MVRPRLVVPLAALSLVTMPLTAVWFLLVAELVLVATLILAAVRGRTPAGDRGLARGFSIGLGLLAGPAVYFGLAVIAAVA